MTRPRSRIGSELLPVCLILGCLVGSWFLVVSMHDRAGRLRKQAKPPKLPAVALAAPPRPIPQPPPPPPPEPEEEPEPEPAPPPPAPVVEDPTRVELARIGAEEATQRLESQAADRRAEALERARKSALAQSQSWKRRESVIRHQLDSLDDRASSLEQEASTLRVQRDVLAREREATKNALARARSRSSYAVLPHRGPNGTWKRPMVIECTNGTATLQPHGPTFSMLDLSGLMGARSSPIVLAVVRELIRIQGLTGPDGAPAVPYIFFVVRPDGIRPYYEARARLEALSIAFGYELVDQDMEIDYPDLDHPDEWDGSAALPSFPTVDLDRTSPIPPAGRSAPTSTGSDDFVWSSNRSSGGAIRGGMGGPPPGAPNWPMASGSGTGGASFGGGGGGTGSGGGGGFGRRGAFPSTSGSPGGRPSRPAATPGMLPPSGGSLAASGGLVTGAGGSGLPPQRSGMPASGGGLGATARGAGAGLPERGAGLVAGSSGAGAPIDSSAGGSTVTLGAPEATDRGAGGAPGNVDPASVPFPVPPHPDDVTDLDKLARAGRAGEQAVPERLQPGEPGADPGERGGMAESSAAGAGTNAGGTGLAQTAAGAVAGGTGSAGGSGRRFLSPRGGPPSTGSISGGGTFGGQSGGEGSQDQPGVNQMAEGDPFPRPREPLRIEVPMEIVIACGPRGAVIHPGGYQLSAKSLKAKGKDEVLANWLKAIVRNRQQVDPMIRPRPSIRYLVEPGGSETYHDVRRQTVLSGIDWPMVLQVADTRVLDFLPRERF